jgi:hypothetical protein
MLAPQVPLLVRTCRILLVNKLSVFFQAKVYKPLPLMVFSAMAFTAGFLSFLFPETNESKLPEEIDKS